MKFVNVDDVKRWIDAAGSTLPAAGERYGDGFRDALRLLESKLGKLAKSCDAPLDRGKVLSLVGDLAGQPHGNIKYEDGFHAAAAMMARRVAEGSLDLVPPAAAPKAGPAASTTEPPDPDGLDAVEAALESLCLYKRRWCKFLEAAEPRGLGNFLPPGLVVRELQHAYDRIGAAVYAARRAAEDAANGKEKLTAATKRARPKADIARVGAGFKRLPSWEKPITAEQMAALFVHPGWDDGRYDSEWCRLDAMIDPASGLRAEVTWADDSDASGGRAPTKYWDARLWIETNRPASPTDPSLVTWDGLAVRLSRDEALSLAAVEPAEVRVWYPWHCSRLAVWTPADGYPETSPHLA